MRTLTRSEPTPENNTNEMTPYSDRYEAARRERLADLLRQSQSQIDPAPASWRTPGIQTR